MLEMKLYLSRLIKPGIEPGKEIQKEDLHTYENWLLLDALPSIQRKKARELAEIVIVVSQRYDKSKVKDRYGERAVVERFLDKDFVNIGNGYYHFLTHEDNIALKKHVKYEFLVLGKSIIYDIDDKNILWEWFSKRIKNEKSPRYYPIDKISLNKLISKYEQKLAKFEKKREIAEKIEKKLNYKYIKIKDKKNDRIKYQDLKDSVRDLKDSLIHVNDNETLLLHTNKSMIVSPNL